MMLSLQEAPTAAATNFSELSQKRRFLASLRMRFSPQTQPVKEAAAEHCVLHTLLLFTSDDGLKPSEISDLLTLTIGVRGRTLSLADIHAALGRLTRLNKVERGTSRDHWRLTEEGSNEAESAEKLATAAFTGVVRRLFPGMGVQLPEYAAAFQDFLAFLFSKLADSYVRQLTGSEEHGESFVKSPVFERALKFAARRHLTVSANQLRSAATTFLDNVADPDFQATKWNFAQNFYIARCWGLDGSGRLLSADLFAGSSVYLDTNVLIQAIEPSAPHHGSFKALSKQCADLGIELFVSQETTNELRDVTARFKSVITEVWTQIPVTTEKKIRNVFYSSVSTAKVKNAEITVDEALAPFEHPADFLRDSGVRLIDDRWFLTAGADEDIKKAAVVLQERYAARGAKSKSQKSALHDAKMLFWTSRDRREGKKAWFLTMDRSLPGAQHDMGLGGGNLALGLDAFLQWMSPVSDGCTDEDLALVFAEALRLQILPPETFLEVDDFRVFADLEWEARTLPAEDVETCIQAVKRELPDFDMGRPQDREKVARIVNKHFANPSRAFKKQIQSLVDEHDQAQVAFSAERDELANQVSALTNSVASLTNSLDSLNQTVLERDTKLSSLTSLIRTVRRGAGVLVFLSGMFVCLGLSSTYGEGANLWQKAVYSAPVGLPFMGITAVLSAALAGVPGLRKIRELLPW